MVEQLLHRIILIIYGEIKGVLDIIHVNIYYDITMG